jgi:hypothetical protein
MALDQLNLIVSVLSPKLRLKLVAFSGTTLKPDARSSYLFMHTTTPLLPLKRHCITLLVQLQRPLDKFGNSGGGFETEFANG